MVEQKALVLSRTPILIPLLISNAVNDDHKVEGFLQSGIYDAAKENRAYLDLVEHLGLADLSLENLAEVSVKSKLCDIQIPHIYSNAAYYKETKFNIKMDYIIKRIDSYWPSSIDKYSVLYNRLFQGKSYQRIAHDFGVQVSTLKLLILDYRKLWRLYKTYLVSPNIPKKLRPEHFEFINQFII